jgi:hypothetical protein
MVVIMPLPCRRYGLATNLACAETYSVILRTSDLVAVATATAAEPMALPAFFFTEAAVALMTCMALPVRFAADATAEEAADTEA